VYEALGRVGSVGPLNISIALRLDTSFSAVIDPSATVTVGSFGSVGLLTSVNELAVRSLESERTL
jgi:hypothetical protein